MTQAQEEDGSSAQFRESPGPREQVIDAIDAPLEDQRKSTVTPVTVGFAFDAAFLTD